MPAWNNGDFYTLSRLQRKDQEYYFYDGAPRDSLPPELHALDQEVDEFVVRLQQQLEWVYSTVRYTRSPIYEHFKRRTLKLAHPLLERRRKACQAVNASDRICAYLPPEIASRIFEFAVAGVQIGDSIPSPPKISETLQLASVTSFWRSLVLANPNLWASFRLLPSQTDEGSWFCLHAFEYFLRRSGNVGLHIHLEIGYEWGEYFYQLVAIIRREAPRIRTLRICFVRYMHAPSDYLASFDFPFPNADVVAIESDDLFNPSLVVPRVSHLRLCVQGVEGFLPYFSALTFLEVVEICLYRLRIVLQAAGALKTLKAKFVPGQLPDILEVNDQGELIITSGINTNIARVHPFVHNSLESLVIDNSEALHTLTLPNLKSLCAWCSHHALASFIARSACDLVRFGVDLPSSIDSLVGMVTVRQLHIEAWSVGRCTEIFSALTARTDPASPDSLNSAITQLQSITICIDACGHWNSWDKNSPSMLSTLVEFHNRYGSKLERFDIHIQPPFVFDDIWYAVCNMIPEYCPIHINGHPIDYYYHPSVPYTICPAEEIGRDRLDYLDRATSFYLRVRDMVGRIFNLTEIRRLLGLERSHSGWGSGWAEGPMGDTGWGTD